MFAVIFRAQIRELDDDYFETAKRMRELAMGRYGCLGFEAVSEGDREIAISYWRDWESIARWRKEPEHRIAQEKGRERWYRSYRVEIVEIRQEYAWRALEPDTLQEGGSEP